MEPNLSNSNVEQLVNKSDSFLAQTCGYPLCMYFHDKVEVVAVPIFDFDGCKKNAYSSILIGRKSDTEPKVAAVNSVGSMSGNVLLFSALGSKRTNGMKKIFTGSHFESIQAQRSRRKPSSSFFYHQISVLFCDSEKRVKDGEADCAAIDCVTFALLRKFNPTHLEGIVEIVRSEHFFGLPLVCDVKSDCELLRSALQNTQDDETARLLLKKIGIIGFRAWYQKCNKWISSGRENGYKSNET